MIIKSNLIWAITALSSHSHWLLIYFRVKNLWKHVWAFCAFQTAFPYVKSVSTGNPVLTVEAHFNEEPKPALLWALVLGTTIKRG